MGRKKIPIKKIDTQSNLEVTFSKRRTGVYTKASELSRLCDCDVAIIIFSPEDNIFAFGEPSVEPILDTFMNQNLDQQNSVVGHLVEDDEDTEWCELDEEEKLEYKATIEAEKTREKTITELPNGPCEEICLKKWWLTPVEDLTLDEAEKMLEKLDEFKHLVNSYGAHTETSSNRQTNEVSLVIPQDGVFPLTPHSYLASTSVGLVRCNKGKPPMQD